MFFFVSEKLIGEIGEKSIVPNYILNDNKGLQFGNIFLFPIKFPQLQVIEIIKEIIGELFTPKGGEKKFPPLISPFRILGQNEL